MNPVEQLAQNLKPLADLAGVELPPAQANRTAWVWTNGTVRDMAVAVADVMATKPIYNRNDEVVVLDGVTGRAWPMDPAWFVTWAERYVTFGRTNRKGEDMVESIGEARAKQILRSSDFRDRLKPLRGVNAVRLPVLDGPEGDRVRLLPLGYDAPTGIFTLECGLEYATDWPLAQARECLAGVFGKFPWADSKSVGSGGLMQGRSFAVHLAAMLTAYCAQMLPEKGRPPLFFYNSNIPGGGKSLLCKVVLLAVHGRAGSSTISERGEEFKKELDSAAQCLKPFLFFDDFRGYLQNELLNSWLTSSTWDGRILGGPLQFSAALRGMTLLAGNQVRLSEDLGRRTLIVDLFLEESVQERELPEGAVELTEGWVLDPVNRGRLLSALYTLVREYYEPTEALLQEPVKTRVIASFVEWSGLIPKIVVAAGYADPTQRVKLPDAGSNEESDRAALVREMIAAHLILPGVNAVRVRLDDLAVMARRKGIFCELLGTVEDVERELDAKRAWPEGLFPSHDSLGNLDGGEMRRKPLTAAERRSLAERYLTHAQCTSFGYRMRKAAGMVFGVEGRRFVFGAREDSRRSEFHIREVTE